METQTSTNKITENLNSLEPKKLELTNVEGKDLRVGIKKDGRKYSVRDHRQAWFTPEDWIKLTKVLKPKQLWTAEVLIHTGARINEARNIKLEDCDFERNTIRLRITKTKARKGERKGKPRTIPIDETFMKRIKKYFNENKSEYIGVLSTPAFNICLKNKIEKAEIKDPYLYSAHNIRKTHGNWLKIMGNLGLMKIDAMEICLRLGHDYNTFLKDYGSSGVLSNQDIIIIRQIFPNLYQR